MENYVQVSEKHKIGLQQDAEILGLGMKLPHLKDSCTSMFMTALFIIAKQWNQPWYFSSGEQIRTMWYSYIRKYYSTIEKEEILPFAITWMNLEDMMVIK